MSKSDLETKEGNTVYELGYHIAATIPEEHVASEVGKIKGSIESHSGMFISEDFPKLRALAYTITKKIGAVNQKFDRAYFGWVKFEMPASELEAVKKEIDANNSVIRHLLIKTVRENTMVSPKIISVDRSVQKSPEGPEVIVTDETVKATPAEIDKSIDELVIS